MKFKITLLMMQADSSFSPLAPDFLDIVVRDDGGFPSKYVSTKTIPETIQELYESCCSLNCDWASPLLSDIRHERGSTECEALYSVLVPEGTLGVKEGYRLTKPYLLQDLEEFYDRGLSQRPRCLQQQQF